VHKKQIATTGLLSTIALSLIMASPFLIAVLEHSFLKLCSRDHTSFRQPAHQPNG
jgi:hypothetical protein